MKAHNEYINKRVFEKARELISTKGFKGWNMDQLAFESGITKPTLYKIISSKVNLYEKIIIEDIDSMVHDIEVFIADENDYETTLRNVFMKYANYFMREYYGYMDDVAREYPQVDITLTEHSKKITRAFVEILTIGQNKGIIRKDFSISVFMELLGDVVKYSLTKNLSGAQRGNKLIEMYSILIFGIINSD